MSDKGHVVMLDSGYLLFCRIPTNNKIMKIAIATISIIASVLIEIRSFLIGASMVEEDLKERKKGKTFS